MSDEKRKTDPLDLLAEGVRLDPVLPPMTPTSNEEARAERAPNSDAPPSTPHTPLPTPGGTGLSAEQVAQLQQTADPAQQEAERALERAEGRVDHTES